MTDDPGKPEADGAKDEAADDATENAAEASLHQDDTASQTSPPWAPATPADEGAEPADPPAAQASEGDEDHDAPDGSQADSAGPEAAPAAPSEPAPITTKTEEPGESAAPPGNKPHWVRGAIITLVGAIGPFALMATPRRWPFSVPVGLVGALIAFFGIADMLGTFDDPDDKVSVRAEGAKLRPAVLELITAFAAWFVSLRLAVAGGLPFPILSAAVLVTGTFLWLVTAGFRAAQALGALRLDETGRERPLLRRHGFWLIVLTTLIYLPLLGSYSLSDPWETHYGEVAREMLVRDDWISLWWAQDGWFWSKPVLDFWMQGLFFSALGVRYMPDQMLSSVAQGRLPQPEWAARIGVFLFTVAAVYLIYKGVAKACGRRAGLLGGIVLGTMPYWFLIAHQSMTDMLYVAPLTASMGLCLLGFHTGAEEQARVYEIKIGSRKLRVSLWHLVFGAVVLLVLPQVLYLLTRNVTLHIEGSRGFRWHLDQFFSGSGGGNCGNPGNEPCKNQVPVNKLFQPWHGAALWTVVTGILLWLNRSERRLSRLYFLGAWVFVALAAMGKGAPGLVLPIFSVGAYIAATRRWRDLQRVEVLSLLLLIACITLPWYVQMYMRHGQPFTDRLLFHDMYKRAFVHVHDTNMGDDTSFRYYVWQLGYGLFPWTGLAAAGLGWWLRRDNDQDDSKGDAGAFLALWFISAFGMFTITLTKFHHYVFPVVPPTAMLIGLMLDRALGGSQLPRGRELAIYLTGITTSVTLAVYGVMRFFPGAITGRLAGEKPPAPVKWIGYLCLGLALVVGYAVIRRLKGRTVAEPESARGQPPGEVFALTGSAEPAPTGTASTTLGVVDARVYDQLMIAALAIASAIVVVIAGRDMFYTLQGDIEGQARLMHLFTYNYRRPWPTSLDFKAILAAFTFVAAALSLLIAVPRLRTHASIALVAVSVLWAAWGVNVYLYKAAPHWGQRETMLAYYADRKNPDEVMISYQMNWKGENFYTGNKTPAFVATGQKFKDFIEEQKKKGITTLYFTTEHGRAQSLKGEIGAHKTFEGITTEALNNKFFTVRVTF
ncbi:MAG: glycosyltransferase family 39 protein [Myxococcales bacterium]|nr:glycosyltransferase family 39 protein [Myxococcales bacterium]